MASPEGRLEWQRNWLGAIRDTRRGGRAVKLAGKGQAGPESPSESKPDPRRLLVLEEARRGIDHQVKDLEGLRTRTGALITLAVGGLTFLAGVVINRGLDVSCVGLVGFILMGAAASGGLNILRPHEFTFSLDIERFDERSHTDGLDDFIRAASFGLRDAANGNQQKLDRLFTYYGVALLMLVAGAAAVIVSLDWR
jgi:hypothetical protein